MSTLLIRNATLITVDEDSRVIHDGALLVEDQFISDLGSTVDVCARHPSPDRVVDASDMVLAPGFISAHNHVGYTIFRGLSEEAGLNCVTGMYFPMATVLSRDERRAIGSLTYAELLRSGVTTVLEMEEEVDVYAEFVDRLGMRSAMGTMISDVDVDGMIHGEYRYDPELTKRALAEATSFAEKWHGKANRRIQAMMTPNMSISSSPELLQGCRVVADRLGIRLSTHAGWGEMEGEIIRRLHGVSPFEYFRDNGLLGHDVVTAHCYVVDDADRDILAHSGAHVAHCPLMNAVRGEIAPILDYQSRGIPVSLGIDNMFSDYFEVVRACLMMARIKTGDAQGLLAPKALELATIAGARALGLDKEVGSLEIGKHADLMVVDFDRLGLKPVMDPVHNLVYHAHREDVKMVLVDGAVVVDDGQVALLDARALLAPAQTSAEDAWRRFVDKYGSTCAT